MLAITAIVILFAVAVVLLVLILLEAKRMSHESHEHHHRDCGCNICRELSQIKHEVRLNHAILKRIEAELGASALPTDMTISQIGDSPMAAKLTNNSIVAGTSGTFQETNIPAGSVYPAGTVIAWAASDPLVTFSPSPDGDPTKTLVNVPATDTAASFQLGVQATGTNNGTPFTVTGSTPITVTITPATPPSNLPTDMSIAQLA
jgi:hypothetical protein